MKKLQAQMHLAHCRSCIQVYTTAAETLEKRLSEGNVGTSVKNDEVPTETNTTNDNPVEVQPEPQTSTRGDER